MCRAEEAAKKQRSDITVTQNDSIFSVRKQPNRTRIPSQLTPQTCSGCGGRPHHGGRSQCPAFNVTCHYCQKVGHYARACHTKQANRQSGANTSPQLPRPPVGSYVSQPPAGLSTIKQMSTSDPAPTILIKLSSLNGSCHTDVLPDSGADISAAGEPLLRLLNDHVYNLLPSEIIPHTANGRKMYPLGYLPVTFTIGSRQYTDNVHIYPNIPGTILSWKAAKALAILPEHYPQLIPLPTTSKPQPQLNIHATTFVPQASSPHLLSTEFPTVFDQNIRSMEGEKFHITLTTNATSFCIKTPRSIPFAYRDKLKAELDLLLSQNVIAPVTEPTEWCAPIVVTPKKNSDRIRMCVDLSHLNKYVLREHYQSQTPAQAVADIAATDAQVFTVLDALKGYHQCPLDESSQLLTTFITPFGRFKYLRAPYGLSSISEHYDRRMADAFHGLQDFRRFVDDIVIYDRNVSEHIPHVRQFLQRCADMHIALNLDKCKFVQPTVTFAGLHLSAQGYQVDRSVTEAISQYPTPTSRTDLRSFIGLVNQLSSSTDTIASLLSPLRPLLSTKNEFLWLPTHDEAFSRVKTSLTAPPVLSFFAIGKETRLSTDASRQGLGFILQQKTGDKWALIQAGSRFLSDAESRYAIIELEMLAVAWAVHKCKMFLSGLQHFSILTDHNPLVLILNTRRLDEIENPRLQRLKSRLMAYSFSAKWIKGSINDAPDALSRNPVSDPSNEDHLAEYDAQNEPEMSITEICTLTSHEHHNLQIQDVRHHSAHDPEYQQLYKIIVEGFPDHRSQLPESCRPYWAVREHLSVDDDLIVYGCRLLIPQAMRCRVLSNLHESHQGTVCTKQRARLTVYCPGMDNDIENMVLSCKHCQDNLPSNPKQPMISKSGPSRPFQEIAVDFCSYGGQTYLIIVDCFTDWPDIIFMGHNTTTFHLVQVMRQSFCRTAIPDILWSDGGPQFTSKQFQDFSKQWGFLHKTSSPHYPQSNGKVEATVKSMKKLISASWTGRSLNEDHLCRALLQYRNTPSRKDSVSPAQKLFGRPVQDTIPAHRRSFTQEWQKQSDEVEM